MFELELVEQKSMELLWLLTLVLNKVHFFQVKLSGSFCKIVNCLISFKFHQVLHYVKNFPATISGILFTDLTSTNAM